MEKKSSVFQITSTHIHQLDLVQSGQYASQATPPAQQPSSTSWTEILEITAA